MQKLSIYLTLLTLAASAACTTESTMTEKAIERSGDAGGADADVSRNTRVGTLPPGVEQTTYVLVHGGGHGGWCYQRVAKLLRQAGHNVFTPTLTGVADRKHLARPDTDLDTHITDVVNLLEYEDLYDVVLVGHSYGGMVITGIGDRATSHIGKMVYLDSIHPKNGDALYTTMAPGGDVRTVDGVELAIWPSEALVAQLGVKDPDDAKWVLSKLTPHPWRSMTQRLELTNEPALRAIPEYEINSSIQHPANPAAKRVWKIETGHDIMITEPEKLAHILSSLAKGAELTDDFVAPDATDTVPPTESDPRCPGLSAGGFTVASCCTPEGQCGINDTFTGMGCLDLAEVKKLIGQMGMAMGMDMVALPEPRACDAGK